MHCRGLVHISCFNTTTATRHRLHRPSPHRSECSHVQAVSDGRPWVRLLTLFNHRLMSDVLLVRGV